MGCLGKRDAAGKELVRKKANRMHIEHESQWISSYYCGLLKILSITGISRESGVVWADKQREITSSKSVISMTLYDCEYGLHAWGKKQLVEPVLFFRDLSKFNEAIDCLNDFNAWDGA